MEMMMGVVRVPTPEAMEEALVELRDLEWRAPGEGRSPFASDGPWHLAQREWGDIAGVYSETLMQDQAGKVVRAWKLDSPRPRTPLRMAEVDRLEQLRGWLLLLPEAMDRRIIWAASFHLWRGEPMDWAGMKRAIAYPHSRQRLARRYREALCKLVCLVNGVPVRDFRALLVRSGGAFADVLPR
jgi:hypothetical protein